ncbi:hypothetical protein, partial [Glycomyces sp. YM15]|uniref:hypothetical protein n=1 Tax=Glycomyces sp. YM15 TaxID=2800446 RepID=UPI0019629727
AGIARGWSAARGLGMATFANPLGVAAIPQGQMTCFCTKADTVGSSPATVSFRLWITFRATTFALVTALWTVAIAVPAGRFVRRMAQPCHELSPRGNSELPSCG